MTEQTPNTNRSRSFTINYGEGSRVRKAAPYVGGALAAVIAFEGLGFAGSLLNNNKDNGNGEPKATPAGLVDGSKATASPSAEPTMTITPAPSASEAPSMTPSPEATKQPEAPYKIINSGFVPMGTSQELPANTVVIGDIPEINGGAWTDDDALSGLVTILTEPATVSAGITYKADYITGATLEDAKKLASKFQDSANKRGCEYSSTGKGCDHTDVLLFPGDPQGKQQSLDLSMYKTDAGTGTQTQPPAPSESPSLPVDVNNIVNNENLTPEQELTQLMNLYIVATPEQRTALVQLINNCLLKCNTVCASPAPSETPAPTPTPSETPAPVCSTESNDINHPYKGWNSPVFNRAKAPKESETITKAIFQSDGAWKLHGTTAWHAQYDDKSQTAQIYVYDFSAPKTVDFSYDWGGDLQEFPNCFSEADFQDRLNKDVSETLKKPGITSVTITYVSANGSTRSVTKKG